MKKHLIFSLLFHGAMIGGTSLLFWRGSFFESRRHDAQARVEVEVIKIGDGRRRFKPSQTEHAKTQVPPLSGQVQPVPQHAQPSPSAVAGGGGEGISIDDDGRPVELTIEEYLGWVTARNEPPRYPRLARIRGEQGRVAVKLVVSSRGSPAEVVELEQSSGSALLDAAALDAVRSWKLPRFTGRAAIAIVVPFRFSLEESN